MGRFLKEKHLEEATSTLKLLHVPFQDSSLHKDRSQIDIGFAAEATLTQLKSSKKISDRQRLEIKMDCKKLLITLLEKLLKKAPVHPTLVRSMQCLDPRRMAESKELCVTQMRRMLHILVEAKHVNEAVCTISLESLESFMIWLLFRLSWLFRNLTPKALEWTPCCMRQWEQNHHFPECGMWWRFFLSYHMGRQASKEVFQSTKN